MGCKLLGLEGSVLVTTVINCCPREDCDCGIPLLTLELDEVTTTTFGLLSTPSLADPFDAVREYWAPVVVMTVSDLLWSSENIKVLKFWLKCFFFDPIAKWKMFSVFYLLC